MATKAAPPVADFKVEPIRAIKKAVYAGALPLSDDEIHQAVKEALTMARKHLSS